jgi:hypothetical protein
MKGFVIAACFAIAALAGCSKPVDPRTDAFARLPDWRGIWIQEDGFDTGISGFPDDLGKPGAKPRPLMDPAGPWTDEGRKRLAAVFASMGARKAPGWGYPMMMTSPAPLQFIVTPEETLIINIYQEVRHVYTDGRTHPKEEDRWVTTWGDSVGHWDGDTLVIDTIWVRQPDKFFQMAPPFSEAAHYVEKLRKTAPDRIETEITVEDPLTLQKPLTMKTAYRRTPNLDRLVHDAFDNDRSEVEGNTFTIAPPRD